MGTIPAPLGGIDQLSAGSAMDPSNCVSLVNMVAGKLGLRVRLGWREWCTNLGGLPVKSILPFTGSAGSGANNRLFACTAHGIWDVSSSSSAPVEVVVFPSSTDDAGWGVCHAEVTGAGHFLVYADEENGLYVYSENGGTWTKYTKAATNNWAGSTNYAVGDTALNDSGKTYRCKVPGASAGSGGPTGTTTGIIDGGVTWDYVAEVVDGVDPANLCFVTVWKNRLMLVEKNTARAWYFGIGAVYAPHGAGAVSFTFGNQFRAGGGLRGLWNYNPSGAINVDNLLVAISDAGDLLVYKGTDIASTDFGMVGAWFVGSIPAGRNIASNMGGPLLIITALGAIPLSDVMGGAQVTDATQYQTARVSTLFSGMSQLYRNNRGWALRIHPEDNVLLALIPVASNQPTQQLVMSNASKGWCQYANLPIFSAETWGGKLYFGTVDGRVCVSDGNLDGTLLDGTQGAAIQWSLLTAFQTLGVPRQKVLQLIRPTIIGAASPASYQCAARYDYDVSELADVTVQTGTSGWDVDEWDEAEWAPEFVTSNQAGGASGIGVAAAIAIKGAAQTQTTLIGIDALFTVGGFL